MTTGLVFGGPSPEHDISILSGLQAARVLQGAGDDIVCIYWTKSATWQRVPVVSEAESFLEPVVPDSTPLELHVPGGFVERTRMRSRKLDLDVVVNCTHGGPGEDGSLSSMLRLAGYRVTGPTPQAASLAMDKLATTAVAESLGIKSIPTRTVENAEALPKPWVVKPRFGGSSLGIEVGVSDIETVRALASSGVGRGGTIVQPFLDGWIDINVAVRTHPKLQASAIERPLRGEGDAILNYSTKYLRGAGGMESTPRELPAVLPDDVAKYVSESAKALVAAMGLTGIPRIDFMWDGEREVAFCEVNPVPGALGMYLWEATGVTRETFLRDWVDEGRADAPTQPQWAASSDGAALRSADTIAAKLAK